MLQPARDRRRILVRHLRIGGHPRTGLRRRCLADETHQIGVRPLLHSRTQRRAAPKMRQVRPDRRIRQACDPVAATAAIRREQPRPLTADVTADRRGRAARRQPGVERGRLHRHHVERHQRVTQPAEFGALPAKPPGARGMDDQPVRPPRNHVELARQPRHPEAVQHVTCLEQQLDVAPDRHAQLVRIADRWLPRRLVADPPPELLAGNGDPQVVGFDGDRTHRGQGGDQQRQQHHGRHHAARPQHQPHPLPMRDRAFAAALRNDHQRTERPGDDHRAQHHPAGQPGQPRRFATKSRECGLPPRTENRRPLRYPTLRAARSLCSCFDGDVVLLATPSFPRRRVSRRAGLRDDRNVRGSGRGNDEGGGMTTRTRDRIPRPAVTAVDEQPNQSPVVGTRHRLSNLPALLSGQRRRRRRRSRRDRAAARPCRRTGRRRDLVVPDLPVADGRLRL
ncbi:hypothetical protein SPHINGO8AM_130259 [Sphingomonas sp. 8AM]|nr:hypothetical protein SPHINGO8AM_130259 [Sphingomonas sp. 8AM]